MKKLLFTSAFFLAIFTAQAKRMQYTCELVEQAQLIGIWETKDLAKNIRSPKSILKGDLKVLKGITIDTSRLDYILNKAKDKQVILIFQIYNKQAHVRTTLWNETSFKKNLETTHAIIKQMALMKKWKSLSKEEQISASDLIVSGQAKDSGKVCPTLHYIKTEKVYKGKPSDRLSVITIKYESLNSDSLFLMQKQPGSGPAYRVMGIIPAKEAKKYLILLK
jgi:hypothetical protein